MKTLVETFLNPSFGETAVSVRTAALKEPNPFQAKLQSRVIRVWPVQRAIYGYYQNSNAQH